MHKQEKFYTSLYDLLVCMTNAVDLVNTRISNHHQQVAYLSYNIAETMELTIEEKRTLVYAALLHDIGAIALDDDLDFIEKETVYANLHAFTGADLFSDFPVLADVAKVIRYHHIPWNHGAGCRYKNESVSILSHIIHLADRVVTKPYNNDSIIIAIPSVKKAIIEKRGTNYAPEVVDAFLQICDKESLWLDIASHVMVTDIPNDIPLSSIKLSLDEVVSLTQIFSRIIDFRSPFTAMHSSGVAATAARLAQLAGLSENECKMMNIAGNLHDIGKLAIPKAILEKQDKLEPEEYDIIRSHTYFTYRLLSTIQGFEIITHWASYHHEKLNGSGYPFHLQGNALSHGARIMAVADIFTAITEDRPYRLGMSKEETIGVLRGMVNNRSISSDIVSLAIENYEDIVSRSKDAAKKAMESYQRLSHRNL